jgi:hypothetical protein
MHDNNDLVVLSTALAVLCIGLTALILTAGLELVLTMLS